MATEPAVAELLQDVARWRALLPEAASTYCQGIASKMAKMYEALIKRAVAQRIAMSDLDVATLLTEIRYGGDATSVDRLPLGAVTNLLLRVTEHDRELADTCPPDVRVAMTRLVQVRNRITHELPPDATRAATSELLDLVETALSHEPLVQLLDGLRKR